MGTPERTGLSWTVTQRNEITVLSASGDLDLATVAEFRHGVDHALSRSERPLLVADLYEVDFCDSSGLSALIWTANSVEAAKGRLVLSRIQTRVAHLLRMTGLASHFRVCDNVSDAAEVLTRPDDAPTLPE